MVSFQLACACQGHPYVKHEANIPTKERYWNGFTLHKYKVHSLHCSTLETLNVIYRPTSQQKTHQHSEHEIYTRQAVTINGKLCGVEGELAPTAVLLMIQVFAEQFIGHSVFGCLQRRSVLTSRASLGPRLYRRRVPPSVPSGLRLGVKLRACAGTSAHKRLSSLHLRGKWSIYLMSTKWGIGMWCLKYRNWQSRWNVWRN